MYNKTDKAHVLQTQVTHSRGLLNKNQTCVLAKDHKT